MEQRRGTVGDLLSSVGQRQNMGENSTDFSSYLTLVGINLSLRFPLDRIDNIDVTTIENVAKLSLFCTPIVVETYSRFIQQNQSQQTVQRQTSRAA